MHAVRTIMCQVRADSCTTLRSQYNSFHTKLLYGIYTGILGKCPRAFTRDTDMVIYRRGEFFHSNNGESDIVVVLQNIYGAHSSCRVP